jgi:hypothetical protein
VKIDFSRFSTACFWFHNTECKLAFTNLLHFDYNELLPVDLVVSSILMLAPGFLSSLFGRHVFIILRVFLNGNGLL